MIKKILSMSLVLVILCACVPLGASAEWTMYVYTDNGKTVNVRSSMEINNYNLLGTLPYGAQVTVYTLRGEWAEIAYDYNGFITTAYMMSRYLIYYKPDPWRPTPTSAPTASPVGPTRTEAEKAIADMNAEFRTAVRVAPFTVVARPSRASGWVNLRWGPNTLMERIATCPQGKELTVLAQMRSWYQVQDPVTGMIGFISREYVIRK